MAYSSTYPPGQVSLLGQNLAADNRMPHITYVGYDGTKFYLAGPLAPTPGAQNGVTALSLRGFSPSFQHLDNQGARQDGTTWFDALYDPAEYDFEVEVSGLSAADTRATIRSWLGSWSPKLKGRLHAYTPENGEWWARVRQLKQNSDPITHSFETFGKQRFNWSARNDDAFWESFDSVAQFGMALTTVSDPFTTVGPTLGSNWTQVYSGAGAGTCVVSSKGVVSWSPSGDGTREVVNRYHIDSATDNQVISMQYTMPPGFDLENAVANDIWGRLDDAGNGVRCRITAFSITLSRFVGGVETIMWVTPLLIPPLWNETFTLICGTNNGTRNFKVQRDGFTRISYTETGTASLIGATHRGWGFGMQAGPGLFAPFIGGQATPAAITNWHAGDNNTVTQGGMLHLSNRGDQDGWPRYLCYGPGTFSFSDGPTPAANTVTFGPLLEDQIALITTLPRLRGVTDLSPSQPVQVLTTEQTLMEELISFAFNNNVPPLLQQFESLFGILPPQGNMYALLTNRFTTPIPAKSESLPPANSQIAVTVVGGNADTKIVGALTPLRRWPL